MRSVRASVVLPVVEVGCAVEPHAAITLDAEITTTIAAGLPRFPPFLPARLGVGLSDPGPSGMRRLVGRLSISALSSVVQQKRRRLLECGHEGGSGHT